MEAIILKDGKSNVLMVVAVQSEMVSWIRKALDYFTPERKKFIRSHNNHQVNKTINISVKDGFITLHRTCATANSKEGCHLTKRSSSDFSEECTCSAEMCNDKSIRTQGHNHIDCYHCSSTIQPWCSNPVKETWSGGLLDHLVGLYKLEKANIVKPCNSKRCVTEFTGKLLIHKINHIINDIFNLIF